MSRKQVLMNDVAIVLTMSERRAFLGPKEDGYVYLPSVEALRKFEAHIDFYKSREEYSCIEHRELHSLNSEGVVALADAVDADADRPWLWSKTDFTVKHW